MRKRFIAIVTMFIMVLTCCNVNAKVLYMPDVTSDMSKASYWSGKMPKPDKVLADMKEIGDINQAISDQA